MSKVLHTSASRAMWAEILPAWLEAANLPAHAKRLRNGPSVPVPSVVTFGIENDSWWWLESVKMLARKAHNDNQDIYRATILAALEANGSVTLAGASATSLGILRNAAQIIAVEAAMTARTPDEAESMARNAFRGLPRHGTVTKP